MSKWTPYPLTEEQLSLKGLKLHLGPNLTGVHSNNFINVDIDPNNKVADLICDASAVNQTLLNGSISLILASHIIEHFSNTEAIRALKVWHDVLMPGGWLVLELPDMRKCMKLYLYSNSADEKNDAAIGIWGRFDWNIYQGHRYGYTADTLSEILEKIGFKNIEVKEPLKNHAYSRSMRIDCKK